MEAVELLLVSSRTPASVVLNIGVRLGRPATTSICDDEQIARLIDFSYQTVTPELFERSAPVEVLETNLEAALAQTVAASDRDLLILEGKGPVIRLADAMLFEALSRHASDIHIQPLADRTLIRYRIDGVLTVARELPHSLTNALVSRIKVMARMDVAERHAPQDGRATVTLGRSRNGPEIRSVDLRISTLPTNYGERAVIRLLDNARGSHLAGFESLGMPRDVQTALLDRAGRSHGIILVTGPTGSGKTTTLYTLLRHIATGGVGDKGREANQSGCKRGDLNIMTIEDPIEYELSIAGIAISQSQINPKKGVTFATGLRHILRQDPDVVMVGEIRDAETTRIAMQASLTGHLVLSTLHTNDAASAVARLVDLGAERYLVAASLSAVMAQRLLRRIHSTCRGARCEACHETGYSGRLGVFELLMVDDAMRDLISQGSHVAEIRARAAERGMRTLLEEGQRLIEQGLTDSFEVRRVLQGMADPTEERSP
ncbi:MAG: GspE/PulE family protein [Phycisphaerales bacterium]